jgi:hypothetical protein
MLVKSIIGKCCALEMRLVDIGKIYIDSIRGRSSLKTKKDGVISSFEDGRWMELEQD